MIRDRDIIDTSVVKYVYCVLSNKSASDFFQRDIQVDCNRKQLSERNEISREISM